MQQISSLHCTYIVELIRLTTELGPCCCPVSCPEGATVPADCASPAHKSAVCQDLLTLHQPARLVVREQSDLEKIVEQVDSMQSAPSAVVHWSGALNLVFKTWKSPVTLSKKAVNCQHAGFSSFGL